MTKWLWMLSTLWYGQTARHSDHKMEPGCSTSLRSLSPTSTIILCLHCSILFLRPLMPNLPRNRSMPWTLKWNSSYSSISDMSITSDTSSLSKPYLRSAGLYLTSSSHQPRLSDSAQPTSSCRYWDWRRDLSPITSKCSTKTTSSQPCQRYSRTYWLPYRVKE